MRCLRLRGRAVHMWHAGKRSPRACVNAQVCMCLIMTLIVPAFAGAILWPRGGFSSRCHRRRHVHVLGSHVSISSSQSAVRGAPGRRCTSPSVHTLHSPACRNYSRGSLHVHRALLSVQEANDDGTGDLKVFNPMMYLDMSPRDMISPRAIVS